MTPQELSERIADIPNECFEAYPAGYYSYEEHMKMTKQLLYDVIQAVTPETPRIDPEYTREYYTYHADFIEELEENTKNLLGEKR